MYMDKRSTQINLNKIKNNQEDKFIIEAMKKLGKFDFKKIKREFDAKLPKSKRLKNELIDR